MNDVLVETIQKLTARRAALARDVATLDEAIAALLRVRNAPREAPMKVPAQAQAPPSASPVAALVPARPTLCALASCGKPLPPPSRLGGRPRFFCSKACVKKAGKQRARSAAVVDEDPTDRALRQMKELHPSMKGARA